MVVKVEWFKEWFDSPYYYKLYFDRNEAEAAAFINLLMQKLNPPQGSFLLDIACGRGRHSKLLSSKGFDVTGIDIAMEGLREAQKFENDHLHFFQHDMRLPFYISYFHYAFNFFTSFGYFRTEREHYNAIRTIANSLKPGGILVLDYLNVHYHEDHLIHHSEKQIDDINYYITKWFDETHFYKKIIVEDDKLDEPLVFQEKVAKFTLGDFTDMFAFHNLQIQEVYGDYQLSPYDLKKSPRMIMFAQKTLQKNG